jgi:hypothetical protein
MRTFHKALEAVETYSPAEEQFNYRRRTVGLFLGPLLLVALIAAPLPIPAPAHRLAGILAMMIVFWVTEALPLAVTAMLGPVLAIILRVAPVRQAFASFADPVIFVFIGGFILAEAMFVHGVDQRIAYTALSRKFVGTSATRIMLVFGGVTMLLSMWMSNTATTAMMYPIGLSICAHLARSGASGARQFAMATMLITSFSASIGGMGTPVGTPPNLIGVGMLERLTGTNVTFFQWMVIGVPVMLVMFAFVAVQFHFVGARGVTIGAESTQLVRDELKALGRVTRGQRNVLAAFAITVALWVTARRTGAGRPRRDAVRPRLHPGDARERGGDGGRLPAVRPAGGLARPALHHHLGRGAQDRLGHRLPVRRGIGDGGTGVPDRPGRSDGAGDHVAAAVAIHDVAHDALHGHGDRAVGSDVEHRSGQHDHPDRHRGVAGGGGAAHRAGARRDARRQHGLHDARSRRRPTRSSTAPASSRSPR